MFPKMKFWGSRKRPNSASSRCKRAPRFEQLECRRVLAVLTPTPPIVTAGLVGPDLVISCSSPEANISVLESTPGTIQVIGNNQYYYGDDGNLDQLQTDINSSGTTEVDFTPATPLRDLKIKLSGVDSQVQVGDQLGDGVTVGRDLIISLPASTTATQLAYDSILAETHLNVVVEGDTVARNLTITTGTLTTSESAVIDVASTTVGSSSLKGTLTITADGAVANMVGLAGDTITGNVSVTTGAGDDFIAIVGTTVTGTGSYGRLTISAGAGNNSVLATDDFGETLDSSIQTFITNHEVFGDGLDDEIVDACVVTLTDDLQAASSSTDFSFEATNANIYVLNGDNIVDVHDASTSGGNLVISAGNGTNVIAVTETTIDAVSTSVGNVTITAGNGNNLIILVSLEASGFLSITTGSGDDVILATPDVATVVDAAIADFVANNPGVFFDPTGNDVGGVLDINDLTQEIIDITDTDGFEVYKATITTKDVAASTSIIDISQSDVVTTLTITMGNGSDGLFLSQDGVGIVSGGTGLTGGTATIKVGSGNDTIVVVGVGTLGTEAVSGSAPDGEMNSFTLTTGNGSNTVVISLDWEGDPGYTAGPAYGIDATMQALIATAPGSTIASTLQGVDEELDAVAEYMLSNGTMESLDASHVYLTIGTAAGTGANLVDLSDITISPSTPEAEATNRLNLNLGGGNDYVYFYDNVWDGAFADLNGGGGTNTLDEYRGGNSGSDTTIVNFQTEVPDETP
jgi:hypothetical protein